MTKAEVKIQTGIDNSFIPEGMSELERKVAEHTKKLKDQNKEISGGVTMWGKGLSSELGKVFIWLSVFEKIKGVTNDIMDVVNRIGTSGESTFLKLVSMFDGIRKRTKEARIEMNKQMEETKKIQAEIEEQRQKGKEVNMNAEQILLEKEKALRTASLKIEKTIGGTVKERAELELDFLKKKQDRDEALKQFAKDRDEKAAKAAEEADRAANAQLEKDEKLKKNLEEQNILNEKLNKIRKARDMEQSNQGLDKYRPSVESLARNNRSPVAWVAQRIQFLEKDTKLAMELGNFDYAKQNVKEINSRTKFLKDSGYLETDKFEKLQEESTRTADQLESIVNEGIRIKDSN